MDQEKIVQCAYKAAEEVFSTMFGLSITEGPTSVETTPTPTNEPVVALIGLAGSWIGTGMICCSPEFACKVSGLMLMTEFSSVDGDVLDAIAEISNMIFGNVKTVLEEHVGPLGLSIPTVIFGKNFITRSVGHQPWNVIRISCEAGDMSIRICLAPNTNSVMRHAPVMTALVDSGVSQPV